MFLTYKDLSQVFGRSKGASDDTLTFQSVAISAAGPQQKGIFIPLSEESGELKTAIDNGAIAAVWDEKIELPRYTPTHFPIFFSNDILTDLKKLLLEYKAKLNRGEGKVTPKTNFLFLDEKLLNEFYETYDIAVTEQKIETMFKQLSFGGKE